MVKRAIWQDTFYVSTARKLVYYIKDDDGVTIFAGRAYRLPNAGELKININTICQNYLNNDIRPMIENVELVSARAEECCRVFRLYNDSDTLLEEYQFLMDWSYDDDGWSGQAETLSRPINGRIVDGMLGWKTTVSAAGTVFNNKNRNLYTVIDDSCNKEWALYYLNSYGGWDSLLIEGSTIKKDTITQYTTDRVFDNTTLDYENYRYVAEIVTSYEMNTGWLTDEQSANLAKNLISSNNVYAHNLKEDRIIPVVITDTNVVYQKYNTNGGKLAQYKINIKESQSKLRQ